MIQRWLSSGLVLLGVGLLGVAALDYFDYVSLDSLLPKVTEPYLEVSPTDFDIADGKPGEETKVMVALKNLSSQPVRVVGIGEC